MSSPITVTIDAEDAAIVGKTLQLLSRTNRSPDLTVAARLQRVGEQLWAAAQLNNMFALAATVEADRG